MSSLPTVKYHVYCDGSYKDETAGYGIVAINLHTGQVRIFCGRLVDCFVTNNIAELYAIYVALQLVAGDCVILSDSLYSISVLTLKWEARANLSLINNILALHSGRIVFYHYVEGHSTDTYNALADELAKIGRLGTVPFQEMKYN